MNPESRRARILTQFPELGIDVLLVSHLPNVRYLSGFTGSNAMLVVAGSSSTLFTDPRYAIQAAQEADCGVKVVRGPLWKSVLPLLAAKRYQRVGIESARMTVDTFRALEGKLRMGASLVHVNGLVESARQVKSAAEIEAVRRAVATGSKAFEGALRSFRAGVSLVALAAELDYRMRKGGAERSSFETIVASGTRSALPHARPTAARIGPGPLLIDMGALHEGYCGDMTRMVTVGPPSAPFRRAYRAVLEAQQAAAAAVRPGVTAHSVDAAARKVLRASGLHQAFVHSTGHGLGLEIHEGPRLGRGEKTRLAAGMLITIEPGVYLEGDFGIRIEDTVLVTATGCEILTPTSKELLAV
ncbi:MAG TPA: aminopeptidase P family protein [Solibacterales bacterium]|nr:aminopeptidase P family protein [Bryobacterales bacterium]